MCIDDPVVQGTAATRWSPYHHLRLQRRRRRDRIESYRQVGAQGHFTLRRHDLPLMTVTLNAPGRHNALNAAAAVAVATDEGICDDADFLRALARLPGHRSPLSTSSANSRWSR
jgi:UDP-N-acetylmuramate--alanine ligase